MKISRGFTIVELLVVVVVIAILASITMVSYGGITTQARQTQQLANIKSVKTKAEMYNVINSSYPATDIKTALELDGMSSLYDASGSSCISNSSVTKEYLCIQGDSTSYQVFWWDYDLNSWMSYYKSISGGTIVENEYSNGTGANPGVNV